MLDCSAGCCRQKQTKKCPAPPGLAPTLPEARLPRPFGPEGVAPLRRNQKTRQRIATALPQFRPNRGMVNTMSRPGFYLGPTPRLQDFKHLADLRQAPATKPAPEVLPALVMLFASWVTWLEGVTLQASGRMCGLPPAIVSTNWPEARNRSFRGSEYRSHPLPFDHCFSPLLGPILAPKQRFRHRLPRHSPASPL